MNEMNGILQFMDLPEDSDFELSEDGGSSVASSADIKLENLGGFDNPIDQFLHFESYEPNEAHTWLNTPENPVNTDPELTKSKAVTGQNAGLDLNAQEVIQSLEFGAREDAQICGIPELETTKSSMQDIYKEISQQMNKFELKISDFPSRSRVETQIRCRLEIRQASHANNASANKFLLHLPTDSIARPKFRLLDPQQTSRDDRVRRHTLWLSVDAVNANYPRDQILMCKKCLARERRRAFRKKTMDAHEETYWNKVEERRIIIFNCREVMPLTADGVVELPLRVACYCRHHAAKNGFNVIFTLRDETGAVVGRALSSSIFITDSHKDQGSFHARVPSVSSNSSTASHPYMRPQAHSQQSQPMITPQQHVQQPQHQQHQMHGGPMQNIAPSAQHGSVQNVPSWVANVQDDTEWAPASWNQRMPIPSVFKAIPPSGSVRGGIDVTLLGQNLHSGLVVLFGDIPATSIQCWSDSTIIAQLPPSSQAGVVPITFQNALADTAADQRPPTTFTYINDGDDKLKEIALQMIGYKSTGRIEDAANIAQRILEAGSTIQQGDNGSDNFFVDPSATTEQFVLWVLNNLAKGPAGININLRNSEGQTMLHLASMLGYASIVKAALRLGAYIDSQDVSGYSPLHFAVMCGNRHITRLLLGADADPFHRTRNGFIAHDIADSTVQDLLPTDQRAWYSELNRRGSSSSLASWIREWQDEEKHKIPAVSELPNDNSTVPTSASESVITSSTPAPQTRSVSDALTDSSSDENEPITFNPPSYSQLFPSDDDNILRRRKVSNKSDRSSQIIDIIPTTEAVNSTELNTATPMQQHITIFLKYKKKLSHLKHEILNDKMLLTFWIPLALVAVSGLCLIYMMQHYGSVNSHPLANAAADWVKRWVLTAVNTILPMQMQTQANAGRQAAHHARI